jgi:hypothetical protein
MPGYAPNTQRNELRSSLGLVKESKTALNLRIVLSKMHCRPHASGSRKRPKQFSPICNYHLSIGAERSTLVRVCRCRAPVGGRGAKYNFESPSRTNHYRRRRPTRELAFVPNLPINVYTWISRRPGYRLSSIWSRWLVSTTVASTKSSSGRTPCIRGEDDGLCGHDGRVHEGGLWTLQTKPHRREVKNPSDAIGSLIPRRGWWLGTSR